MALSVLICLAVRNLDEIEGRLSKSAYVAGNKKLYSQAGILGRVMRICTIAMLLTMPSLFARRGLVDVIQLQAFPNSTKNVLVGTWCIMCISSVVFLMLGSF
jgi:hypothetical protein